MPLKWMNKFAKFRHLPVNTKYMHLHKYVHIQNINSEFVVATLARSSIVNLLYSKSIFLNITVKYANA